MNQLLDFVYYSGHLEAVLILSVEPNGFEKLASLAVLESVNESQGLGVINNSQSCVISERMAESFGIKLSDDIRLATGYNLSVVGICVSSVPVFSLTVVNPFFIIISPYTWSIIQEEAFTASGILMESSEPDVTISQLSQLQGAHPYLISTLKADYLSALASIQLVIDSSLISLFASTIFGAILSGWTIASARRREIGLLSSMGMTKNEIAQVITTENATAMITGTIIGFIVGTIVEIAIADIVYRLTGEIPALFDFRIISIILLCLFVSVIFAYIAIRRTCDTRVIVLLRDVSRGH
jgi:ABC-type lipoprotein release transport system permease subunit